MARKKLPPDPTRPPRRLHRRNGKPPGHRPAHQPTDRLRGICLGAKAAGMPDHLIAAEMGLSVPTMKKHYAFELTNAVELAKARVHQSLYKKAVSPLLAGPSVTAAIWLDKTRYGYRETTRNEHTGADGGPIITEKLDLTGATDEELSVLAKFLVREPGGPEPGGDGNGGS